MNDRPDRSLLLVGAALFALGLVVMLVAAQLRDQGWGEPPVREPLTPVPFSPAGGTHAG